jgi:hypothetical protein
MENSKARLSMLALSGLLFGASALGWYLHTTSVNTAQTISVAPSAPVSVAAPVAAIAPTVTAVEPATQLTYPATPREEAVRAARESIRPDLCAPIAVASVVPDIKVPSPPPVAPALLDPPRVSTPTYEQLVAAGQQPEQRYEAPRHDKLTVDDFRLVGLIDGKAIFKIRRDVAHQLGMAQAFTLGKGEQFNNIRVDKVDNEQATVRDGTSIATKGLARVR